MIVPYAPGGNVDVSARVLQTAIGDAFGQPVVIENRPGGAGLIAGDYVARASRTGIPCWSGRMGRSFWGRSPWRSRHTSGSRPSHPSARSPSPPTCCWSGPRCRRNRSRNWSEYARQQPGKLTLATSSIASINHFLGELLKLKAASDGPRCITAAMHPPINDLIAGHVDVGFQQLVDSLQHLQSGKLRASPCRQQARGGAP
jgi:tripartite-type tricarboxylate transporter receptor subunit TctC